MTTLTIQQQQVKLESYGKPCQTQVEEICHRYPQIVAAWPIDYASPYFVYEKQYGPAGMKWDTIKRRAREYRQYVLRWNTIILKAWMGKARQGRARRGKAGLGEARQGEAGQGNNDR